MREFMSKYKTKIAGALSGFMIAGLLSNPIYNSIKDKIQFDMANYKKPAAGQMLKAKFVNRSVLENIIADIGPSKAFAQESAYSGGMSEDDKLSMYMNQPVEETLKGTDVVYVDDSNYQKEVFGSDKPVMVLFYVNEHKEGSTGLATLARVLSKQFPEIKFAAYGVKKLNERGNVDYKDFIDMKEKYLIKDVPALLFYDNDNGKIEYDGAFNGGIKSLVYLKDQLPKVSKDINKHLLD